MRTCQIAKPPSTPAGQSVGVGGMKAHACKICACLAIIPIVFIFNKGALIGEPTRHGHHSHEYSVTDRRHSIQQVHYSRSGSLDHVKRTSFAPLACTTRYPKPPLGTPSGASRHPRPHGYPGSGVEYVTFETRCEALRLDQTAQKKW